MGSVIQLSTSTIVRVEFVMIVCAFVCAYEWREKEELPALCTAGPEPAPGRNLANDIYRRFFSVEIYTVLNIHSEILFKMYREKTVAKYCIMFLFTN